MAEGKNQGNWRKLISEMWRRIIYPFGQPTFIIYFFLIIIFFGGLGVLIPIGKLFFLPDVKTQDLMTIPQALITYAFAISASAYLDLSMSNTPKLHRSFWLLGLGVWVLSMAVSIIGYFPTDFYKALILTGVGTALSLFLWWIANCDNTKLQDSNYNVETAVGSQLSGEGVKDGTATF